MNIFFEEHIALIADMLDYGVEFILIGGYAVNYHGYNRATGDLDVWLKPANENKVKVLALLKKYEIDDASVEEISQLDFTHPLVFSIGDEPYKTDFLTKASGVTYEEAERGKEIFEFEGVQVPFVNLHHLVLTKMGTGRVRTRQTLKCFSA